MNYRLDEEAYNNYFGKSSDVNSDNVEKIVKTKESKELEYTYKQHIPKSERKVSSTDDIPISNKERLVSEDNIDDIDQLGELLRIILNAAWGSDWGSLSPDFKHGESADDVRLPQITFDINDREVAEKTPLKPILMDSIKEVVNGEETGDVFQVYRQWFDCVVEFNFWGRNTLEARTLMNKFELLMGAYSGHLKKHGISEIFFLKEVSPYQSIKFIEGIPMRCLMYYVRLERIQTVRQSLIKKIDLELNVAKETVINSIAAEQQDSSDDIYNTNNIMYKL